MLSERPKKKKKSLAEIKKTKLLMFVKNCILKCNYICILYLSKKLCSIPRFSNMTFLFEYKREIISFTEKELSGFGL